MLFSQYVPADGGYTRDSYSSAINNMKIAEIINNERIRCAGGRFRDHEKSSRAQHETERHSEINLMISRHVAGIVMTRAEADMLKATIEMADHRGKEILRFLGINTRNPACKLVPWP